GRTPVTWIVRTREPVTALAPTIRQRIEEATGLPAPTVQPMEEVVRNWMSDVQWITLLMTVFACCALALAALGIYGLIAYNVEQRTHEIGIRLALGARAEQVRNMVIRQGMGLTIAGVIVGLAAAIAASRVMEAFLFGIVGARDPVVFLAVPIVLVTVAFL